MNQAPGAAHILVVEDDQLQREALQVALSWRGYRTETALSGFEAFEKAQHSQYDLLLIDQNMPGIDGLATARLVRDLNDDTNRPVLLALTAVPDQVAAREAAHEPVFDGIIAKPANLTTLISNIERALGMVLRRATPEPKDAVPARKALPTVVAAPRARVLIVEDDTMQQEVLWHAFGRYGYDVDTASDGFAAVRKARHTPYDLIMIDYRMPGMDGQATARLILDSLSTDKRPRMIALTVAAGSLVENETHAKGVFDEIIPKTPDLPALIATVRRHLDPGRQPRGRGEMPA